MTPEERASAAVGALAGSMTEVYRALQLYLKDQQEKAVAEEREACIEVIKQTMSPHPGSHAAAIAGIRARGK